MATAPENVLELVKKLFALAGNNPSEAEAALAMEKAQAILAKYNMSMAQVDAYNAAQGRVAEVKRTKDKVEKSAMFRFQRDIWKGVADANFCVYWSQPVYHTSGIYSTHHHYLIGREENVATVRVMGEYLQQAVNRLCPYKSGKDVHLWKEGCAERLVERLHEQLEKRKEESRAQAPAEPGCTALVLADVIDREIHGNHVFQYGAGSERYCPCRQCRNRRNLEYEEQRKKEELERQQFKAEVALHGGEVSTGQPEPKPETASQRRRREEASRRYWAREDAKWERKREKERAKRSSEAFQSGRRKADDIGLDSQIGRGTKKGELK